MVSFNVDIDSPKTLLKYWGISRTSYNAGDLDYFYEVSMERALALFRDCGIKVTFFCVGEELENNSKAGSLVKEAHCAGHEIANHSYSHPYEFRNLSEADLYAQIERCSDVIESLTGHRPVGFRAPGYDIDESVINLLERLSYEYDSSAFWSSLKPLFKRYHRLFREGDVYEGFGESSHRLPNSPYYPSRDKWQSRGPRRNLIEIPLARTRILNLPFYSNFHLMLGDLPRRLSIGLMRQRYFVYTFHLVEFVDFNDRIPKELMPHPNIRTSAIEKLDRIKDTIKRITKRYCALRMDEFARGHKNLSLEVKATIS